MKPKARAKASAEEGKPSTADLVHPKNALNHLTGGQWLYFTKSILTTAFPSAYGHELRKAHGANKPPELMRQLVEYFTQKDELVLDPFAGVGGTLIGTSLAEPCRRALGIEINSKWIGVYRQVLESCPELRPFEILQGDARDRMDGLEAESVHFVATDPPYNKHFERTMCTGAYEEHKNRQTDYDMRSDDPGDLANSDSYEAYLDGMEEIFAACHRVLVPGRYLVFIVRNAYQDGRYSFTQADLAHRAERAGFVTKGEIVWYQAGTRLRPYGYPYAYVPNICHQNIVVMRKEPSRSRKKRA